MEVIHQQSVVILGAMNPAIHHPAWYNATSIIGQAELKQSLSRPLVVNSQFAQFQTDDFSLTCLPDRWQISSVGEDGKKLIELSKNTFAKLEHTPINAYGVNHDFHIKTDQEIPQALGTIIRKTGLPFPENENGTASITYLAEVNKCTFRTIISASPRGANFLLIQNNAHFVIAGPDINHFDLGPLLEEAFQSNEERSNRMRVTLVNAILESL